jgi:hypothetical protein
VQLQEVTLLIQLVGVAVEEAENGLQLWQRVVCQIHDWGLVSVEHRHGARGAKF